MKMVVLDGYTLNPGDLDWSPLEALGELTIYDESPEDTVLERIGDAEVIFTNKSIVSAETIQAAPNLRYIGILATGYNVVDLEAAREKNIPVCNVPGYGSDIVAQATMAMLLEICHHTAAHSESVHRGEWSRSKHFCYWESPIIELVGKTIGIIGLGGTGRRTAQLANAFGMKVLAYRRHPSAEDATFAEMVELDELFARSDVITLHCPLNDANHGIINADNLAKMKDGVIVLNLSRGPLVNEADLAAALHSGKVYAAGVDVLSVEPPTADNPLLSAPNCFITPHIAWAAKESRQRILDMVVDNLASWQAGKPIHVVNN